MAAESAQVGEAHAGRGPQKLLAPMDWQNPGMQTRPVPTALGLQHRSPQKTTVRNQLAIKIEEKVRMPPRMRIASRVIDRATTTGDPNR